LDQTNDLLLAHDVDDVLDHEPLGGAWYGGEVSMKSTTARTGTQSGVTSFANPS